jgi:hypothetical protein
VIKKNHISNAGRYCKHGGIVERLSKARRKGKRGSEHTGTLFWGEGKAAGTHLLTEKAAGTCFLTEKVAGTNFLTEKPAGTHFLTEKVAGTHFFRAATVQNAPAFALRKLIFLFHSVTSRGTVTGRKQQTRSISTEL